jgi:hypothetical protein
MPFLPKILGKFYDFLRRKYFIKRWEKEYQLAPSTPEYEARVEANTPFYP